MAWFAYALVGIVIWSGTAVADRYFLLRHVKDTRLYVVIPALLQFALVMLIALFTSFPTIAPALLPYAILTGAAEAVFLYFLFVAMSREEVSRVFPLASVGPIFTLLLGWVIFGETLATSQIVALALFCAGGAIVSAKFGGGAVSFSRGLKPLVVGSLIFAVFLLPLRQVFVESDFWTGVFYSRLGFFLAGVAILWLWRPQIAIEWNALSSNIRTAVVGNQAAAFAGHIFYFLAISLSNAALVQSTLAIQSVVVFFMAFAVSYWRPGAIEESTSRRDMAQKALGIALIVGAAYLLAG